MDSAGKRLLAAAKEMRETVRQDMDSVEIPDDLMRIATEIAQVSVLDRAERIARAILAERERCARITENLEDPSWCNCGRNFARAIRKGDAGLDGLSSEEYVRKMRSEWR
jgi:hypothetical protein